MFLQKKKNCFLKLLHFYIVYETATYLSNFQVFNVFVTYFIIATVSTMGTAECELEKKIDKQISNSFFELTFLLFYFALYNILFC